MKFFFFFLFSFFFYTATAQYAPQVGLPGCDAIAETSSAFVNWASRCSIQRGYKDIALPDSGFVTSGDSSLALGPADRSVVSLGDSGVATLSFPLPIYNGEGPDFAVFENAFPNPANDSQAFLELAFVEVSSDGVHYTRFPANSLTQVNTQVVDPNDYMYANNVNNLAGKYLAGYGTPFDLQELADSPGLDINHITQVRIVDVIGSIHGHFSFDCSGRIINDPYPTPFATGGFDLDAVGVIYQGVAAVRPLTENTSICIYPNPAGDYLHISVRANSLSGLKVMLTDVAGSVLQQLTISGNTTILSMVPYPAGMYFLILSDANGNKWVEKVTRR